MHNCDNLVLPNRATLGLVKSGSNNRLALLSEVVYIILQSATTEGGSNKRRELLTGGLLTKVYCRIYFFRTTAKIVYPK